MKRLLFLLFALFVVSCTGRATALEPRGTRDIRYTETPGVDVKLQSLDIYAPPNATNLPVTIFVHGGAWARGDKSQVANLPAAFAREGFILVSVNYRLAPQVKFDAQAQDVAAAIGWVHRHAREYGGDPNQLFTMGHSAGATGPRAWIYRAELPMTKP